jgi:hypothetical protein
VVDKQGIRPCTRASADADCTPGDMSAIHFTVEPLKVLATDPADGAEDVPLVAEGEADASVHVHLNGWINADSALADGAFALKVDDKAVDGVEVAMDEEDPSAVVITVAGGFQPETTYSLTIGGLKDTYGAVLPAVPAITWTTAAAKAALTGR